jgi:hypothetical protein
MGELWPQNIIFSLHNQNWCNKPQILGPKSKVGAKVTTKVIQEK